LTASNSSIPEFQGGAPAIIIRGARQHNLKNIDLDIPRGKLVVITGVSGSGKSSLAFDTLYAEGQRRYVESLSAYARQFLERMDRPDVDLIDGLSPAIAIEQKPATRNPRSTVGTLTEIYDYLRVLYARLGQPHCPDCGAPLQAMTVQQMVDKIIELPRNTKIFLMAPLVSGSRGRFRRFFSQLRREGFIRARVDGRVLLLEEPVELEPGKPHHIDLVVDRLAVRPELRRRITDSLELALSKGAGRVKVATVEGQEWTFSEQPNCLRCNVTLPELSPQLFSFNSGLGACSLCSGLGHASPANRKMVGWTDHWQPLACPACGGARLRPAALAVEIDGLNIHQVSCLHLEALQHWMRQLHFSPARQPVAQRLLDQMEQRLEFLCRVGLSYLSLDRPANTLSGGETQRLRLATQIGTRLAGVLYILDEPSIGLHQRDNRKLLRTLAHLRDLGNTVIVVEHDVETIMAAEQVIDMGPGAGTDGGRVIYSGTPAGIFSQPASLTGQYLSGKLEIPIPTQRRKAQRGYLRLEGATENNLANISVAIPIGLFTCVTGVSGSGKSTLIIDTLYRAALKKLHRSKTIVGAHRRLTGLEAFDKVVHIDQSAIGRSPRSNPATYTGVLSPIRTLLAQVPEARARGYRASRFSFNVKGGRCETCAGDGTIRIEMHFLPDVYVTCDACKGSRFNRDTLEITYRGKNIADILKMTIEEAAVFFASFPAVKHKLTTMEEVGLGYLKLGQAATTLSGGEAQRIKLSRELGKRSRGTTLYLLDEPTTGLHFDDIKKLLEVLNRLVAAGNTVVVIEHQLDVIKSADYVIDLGPEGGAAGGRVLACGPPEEIARVPESYTGRYLREVLK